MMKIYQPEPEPLTRESLAMLLINTMYHIVRTQTPEGEYLPKHRLPDLLGLSRNLDSLIQQVIDEKT